MTGHNYSSKKISDKDLLLANEALNDASKEFVSVLNRMWEKYGKTNGIAKCALLIHSATSLSRDIDYIISEPNRSAFVEAILPKAVIAKRGAMNVAEFYTEILRECLTGGWDDTETASDIMSDIINKANEEGNEVKND